VSARTLVWSCGGGTQSAAIAALIVQGRLPKPDISLMMDTEREKSSTWEYFHAVLVSELARVGVSIDVVAKSHFATVDLFGGEAGITPLLPGYTSRNLTENGTPGKLSNWCSGEWKREVANRYLRRERGVVACRNWIGISVDEARRVRTSRSLWCELHYPLIFDVPMRRVNCEDLVTRVMGWPKPPRSACYQCPNQSDGEWLEQKIEAPQDFALAVQLERTMQETDPEFFLHQTCVPLDEVDFRARVETGDGGLFGIIPASACGSGMCWV
jgi:hypothetical protein